MAQDDLAGYYDAKHSSYRPGRVADNAHAHIPKLIGTGHRVLDVGCGEGHLGQLVRAAGNHVTGLELAPGAATLARDRLDAVIVGSLEDPQLSFPAGGFDVVVCADILEHLFDPAAALGRLRTLMSDDGRLIASIPNVAHFSLRWELLCGRWEYQDVGLLDHGHIRFYTRASAERLLADAGYRVTDLVTTSSIPLASPGVRRIIDWSRRLPRRLGSRLAPLLAAQFIFVARPG